MTANPGKMLGHHEKIDILQAAQRQADYAYDRKATVQLPMEEPRVMSNSEIAALITAEETALKAAAGFPQT
jgi:hypothetical protein